MKNINYYQIFISNINFGKLNYTIKSLSNFINHIELKQVSTIIDFKDYCNCSTLINPIIKNYDTFYQGLQYYINIFDDINDPMINFYEQLNRGDINSSFSNGAVIPLDKENYLIHYDSIGWWHESEKNIRNICLIKTNNIYQTNYFHPNDSNLTSNFCHDYIKFAHGFGGNEEDCCLLRLVNGDILESCTVRYYSHTLIGVKFIKNPLLMNLKYIPTNILVYSNEMNGTIIENRKNWCFFEYESNIYIINTINPLTILQVSISDIEFKSKAFIEVKEIQRLQCPDMIKLPNFGNLRGGTPLIYVRGRYLGIYHSKEQSITSFQNLTNLPMSSLYNMGAYTLVPTS